MLELYRRDGLRRQGFSGKRTIRTCPGLETGSRTGHHL